MFTLCSTGIGNGLRGNFSSRSSLIRLTDWLDTGATLAPMRRQWDDAIAELKFGLECDLLSVYMQSMTPWVVPHGATRCLLTNWGCLKKWSSGFRRTLGMASRFPEAAPT